MRGVRQVSSTLARSVRCFGSAAPQAGGASTEWSPEVYSATDAWSVQYYMKVDILLNEILKIPKSEQAAFKQKYEISKGHWTLEWCHPSPMPFHTYEELPIIKEAEERH